MTCRADSDRTGTTRASRGFPDREPGSCPRRHLVLVLTVSLAAPAAAPARADTIHLKDGRSLSGADCRQEAGQVVCRRAGGTFGVPADLIARIERRPAAPEAERSGLEAVPPILAPRPLGTPTPSGTEAARARLDAIRRAPGDADRAEMARMEAWLGIEAMQAGDLDEARDRLSAATAHDPELTPAVLNLAAVLIRMGHYDEASARLAGLLAERPDHPDALFLAGEARFLSGRTEEAIGLWERSHAGHPREEVLTRLEKARRLVAAEEGFRRSDGARFALRYDGDEASPALAEEILSYLEASYDRLARRLGTYPEGVIQVVVYARRSFHEVTDSPSSVGGIFDGVIRVPAGGLERLEERSRRVLVHELAHHFVAVRSRDRAPRWLHEGYAQVVEGRDGERDRRGLLEEVQSKGPASAAEFGYAKSLSQVDFFLRSWSESHLSDLLDRLGRGTDIDSAFRDVTGLTWAEFLAAWAAWLSR